MPTLWPSHGLGEHVSGLTLHRGGHVAVEVGGDIYVGIPEPLLDYFLVGTGLE